MWRRDEESWVEEKNNKRRRRRRRKVEEDNEDAHLTSKVNPRPAWTGIRARVNVTQWSVT